MTVRELMGILADVDPDRMVVVIEAGMGGGYQEATAVVRSTVGGIGYRYSIEEVGVVILLNGNGLWMESQGWDVAGYIPARFERTPEESEAVRKALLGEIVK